MDYYIIMQVPFEFLLSSRCGYKSCLIEFISKYNIYDVTLGDQMKLGLI
jgi:hypothetical protein